jgi:hypothetical protein
MTRLTLASLVLAISILPLYAQSSSLHMDGYGYTTGHISRTVTHIAVTLLSGIGYGGILVKFLDPPR